MAMKKISEFVSATPTSEDKILFEHSGSGKSTTLSNLPISAQTQAALDTKVNTANVLTYEEIMSSTDLSGKIASAGALRRIASVFDFHVDGESLSLTILDSCLVVINGAGNNFYYIGIIFAHNALDMLISDGTYDSKGCRELT